jgi:hypothetical protein
MESRREAVGQPDLAVDPAQQERAKVRRQGSALEVSAHGMASHGRKTELFWARIGYKQTSCGFYGMAISRIPFYQRLTRGLCFFMKNSG